MYNLLIENRESLKLFYALIIITICFFIVLKSHRLFRLSNYQGIRYFRNAFFFYGLAFLTRYFFGSDFITNFFNSGYSFTINIIFEFFLVMAGFFLLYSLIWKKIEPNKTNSSSLFNTRVSLFYIMALVIVFLDYLWITHFFMFFSQVVLFAFAIIISYYNYKRNGKKHNFLRFYFLAMIFSFLAWFSNSVAALYLQWNRGVLISVYILNILIFLLFLYGVVKATKKW